MAINDILDEIENLVVDAKHVLFTNKALLDEEELVHLVDELRKELPKELQQAGEIMKDRDTILAAARAESEHIIEEAKNYANRLVSEKEIVRQAEERAQLVLEQSKAQEEEIMTRTMQQSEKLRSDADQYANQVFNHLIANVDNALQVLQQAQGELNRGKERVEDE